MSFPVALQSAVFYILSCTPCLKVRHRHRAREIAKKDREKATKLEATQPGKYQHPPPFSTNPYWKSEIDMGPSLPKKTSSKNSSSRGLTSSGRDSCNPSVSERTNVDDSRTNVDSLSVLREEENSPPPDWNRKIGYQREDEDLWGQWSAQKLKDAINRARDSAGRLIDSTLGLEKEVTDQERRNFYTTPRNPPVNDYHPPVISSRPAHKDGYKWMLQPPPPAKVMEGKVPVSRANSSGSKSSGRTLVANDPYLDKIVKDKLAIERARKGSAAPTEDELIEALFATRINTSNRAKSLSYGWEFDDKSDGSPLHSVRSKPAPAFLGKNPAMADDEDDDLDESYSFNSDDDDPYDLGKFRDIPQHVIDYHAKKGWRPKLETICSMRISKPPQKRPMTRKQMLHKSRKLTMLKVTSGSPVGDDTE
ncbi:hypothetical protein G3M48_006540 [Beauveria asiatica]|uniref:Signal peptide-containing protein n=1 Tax=Beauveria asiatica TaxID=1069075 RepID=A0AAW0RNY1_9HYPO